MRSLLAEDPITIRGARKAVRVFLRSKYGSTAGNAVTANPIKSEGVSVIALPSVVVYARFSFRPPLVVVTWISGPPPPIVKS